MSDGAGDEAVDGVEDEAEEVEDDAEEGVVEGDGVGPESEDDAGVADEVGEEEPNFPRSGCVVVVRRSRHLTSKEEGFLFLDLR